MAPDQVDREARLTLRPVERSPGWRWLWRWLLAADEPEENVSCDGDEPGEECNRTGDQIEG